MNTQLPGITFLWPSAAPSSFLGAHATETARRTAQRRLQEILSLSRAPSPSGPVQRFLQADTGSWIDLREIVDWTRSDGVKAEPEKYSPAVALIIRDVMGWPIGAQILSISGNKVVDHPMASVVITTADDLTGASIRLGAPSEGRITIAPDLRSAVRAAGRVNASAGAGTIVAPQGQSLAALPIPMGVKRIEIVLPRADDEPDYLAGTAALALRATMRGVKPVAISVDRQGNWFRSPLADLAAEHAAELERKAREPA